ncbi:MAG: hypothetical protein K6E52_11560 [Bacteroidaceae bacterium]|jgi:hypothetical protein|nr:hypothetical protein [Bacteroidaceae bacterium]
MRKRLMLMAILCSCVSFAAWADGIDGDTDEENEKSDFSVVVGYVNKQWASDLKDHSIRENMWREEDKRLHGFQIGFSYTPTLPMGLGVYTGLFGEFYLSFSKAMGYDEFTEFSLYVPIHANFTLPLSRNVSLKAHGGFGLNYACHGGFTNRDAYYWDWVWDEVLGYATRQKKSYELDHIRYGKNGWPKRFNAALELNVGVSFNNIIVSGGYSWGLTDHQLYKDVPGSSTRQDKLTISVGYEF